MKLISPGFSWLLLHKKSASVSVAAKILATLLLFCQGFAHAGNITVLAAASLIDVLTELEQMYEQEHPDVTIKTAFAGSSALAKQIENGAPADLFISADKEWGDYLQTRGLLVAATRKDLLGNELVIVTPKDFALAVTFDPAFNLAASFQGRWCTGEPAYVPVGKYAKQALSHYRWWNAMQPRLAGTDDVRTALAFVERGECRMGIVYKTDAAISRNVAVAGTFPVNSHAPIIYPGGLLKNARPDAAGFWQFLQGEKARAVFVRYGFTVLP